jgi:O-antigen/teichoic acid export membrane protein
MGRGVGYITVMNIINSLIAFFFYATIARIVGTSDVGKIALIFLVISLFNTVTLFALNLSVTWFMSYFLGKGDNDGAFGAFRASLRTTAIISAISFIAFLALSPMISSMTGLSIYLIVGAIIAGFISNFSSLLGGALYGLSKYREVALQNIIFYVMSRIPALALALFMGPAGVVIAWIIGSVAGTLYPAYILKRNTNAAKRKIGVKDIMKYGMPLYILALVGFAQGWLGISALYAVTGSLSVIGIYYLISSSASLLGILYTPLTSVLFPSMSYKFGESGHGAIRDTIRAVEGLVFYVTLTVSLSVAAASRPLLTLFYGSAYAADSLPFSVLAIATIFGALGGVYSTGLQSMGRTDRQLIVGIVSVAVLFAGLLAFAKLMGPMGVAIASFISSASSFALSHHFIRSHSGYTISVPWRKVTFSALVALAVLCAQLLTGNMRLMFNVFADVIAFIVAFLLLSKLIKPLTEWEKDMFRSAMPSWIIWVVKLI